MTTAEFWDKYTSENLLDIFEETCEFFSQDLPEEFFTNYDVIEVLLETKGHQESAKNFENVLKFIAIVRENHPDLYLEVFEYFDIFLINYYCYHGEEEKLREAFANFQAYPLHSLEKYLLAFKQLVYHQHTGILQEVVTKNFDEINEYDDSYGNPEYDLASFVYCETLEKAYLGNPDEFDRKKFSDKLSHFNYKFEEYELDSIEKGLFKPVIEAGKLTELLRKEKRSGFLLLKMYFLRHMYGKGFKFYLSSDIWNQMLGYWGKENNYETIPSDYHFESTTSGFEEYIFNDVHNSWFDNTDEIVGAAWGSVYVYEFLYQLELINQKTFDQFLETSRKIKGLVIGQYSIHLWNTNFVHHWEKPDCVPEPEFREEEKIFRKSLNFTYLESLNLLAQIQEELAHIGSLADDIRKGVEANNRRLNRVKKNIDGDGFYYGLPGDKPFVRTEKKVGRNEPCPCGSGKKYKKCCGKKN